MNKNNTILINEEVADVVKDYVRSIEGTSYEKYDIDTYVPFTFPKGMVLQSHPGEGTRDDARVKSKAYLYEDEVNGIKRYFIARVVRYTDMDEQKVHPELRLVFIRYSDGFKHDEYSFLLPNDHFESLLNGKF